MPRRVVIVDAQLPGDADSDWISDPSFRICGAEHPPTLDDEVFSSPETAERSARAKGYTVLAQKEFDSCLFSPPEIEQDEVAATEQKARRRDSFTAYAPAFSDPNSGYRILRLVVYAGGRIADEDMQPMCPFAVFLLGESTAVDTLSKEDLAIVQAKVKAAGPLVSGDDGNKMNGPVPRKKKDALVALCRTIYQGDVRDRLILPFEAWVGSPIACVGLPILDAQLRGQVSFFLCLLRRETAKCGQECFIPEFFDSHVTLRYGCLSW